MGAPGVGGMGRKDQNRTREANQKCLTETVGQVARICQNKKASTDLIKTANYMKEKGLMVDDSKLWDLSGSSATRIFSGTG